MRRRERRKIIRGEEPFLRRAYSRTEYRATLTCPRCGHRSDIRAGGRFDRAPRHTCTGCFYNGPTRKEEATNA